MSPVPAPTPEPSRFAADDRFVRALARQLTGDAHLADDAAQETWLRALQRAQAPGLFAEFGRGWLCVVARNFVLQTLRGTERRQRREREAALARAGDAGTHGHDPDAELCARLRAAVQALPADARAVVEARFFEDCMPVEIADRLGLPVETVRTRLKRALHRLRQAIR
ncbi:MAG TPA: sigma-70 family RNA polymerase sigma factor [Planctomycetota bacterium]